MAKLPRVRVVPADQMPIDITAKDLVVGDIWLGGSPIRIDKIEPGDTIDLIPWHGKRNAKAIPTVMVRIHGQIVSGQDRGFKGTWSLQPDTPVEVERTHP